MKMDAHVKLAHIWARVSVPPEGLESSCFISDQEKHSLHYIYAPAKAQKTKGCVVMTHGYLEYSALYYDTIKRYQELGYNVFMMDFFGFGRSGRENPDKPNVPSKKGLSEHVHDVDDFIKTVVLKHHDYDATQPLFMSTNSMGGQIGMIYLQAHPNVFTGAILSSPLMQVNFLGLPPFCRPLVQSAIAMGNKFGLADVPMAKSWDALRKRSLKNMKQGYGLRDHLIGDIHNSDADMNVGVPTWGWLESTFATSAQVMNPAFLRSIQTPILWGTAGNDSFLDLKSHYDAVQHISCVNHVFLPDAMHALWRDNDESLGLWWAHVERFLGAAPNDNAHAQKHIKRHGLH